MEHILTAIDGKRNRFQKTLRERNLRLFASYHQKHKVDRHSSKEAVNQRGLGRSEESIWDLQNSARILKRGP